MSCLFPLVSYLFIICCVLYCVKSENLKKRCFKRGNLLFLTPKIGLAGCSTVHEMTLNMSQVILVTNIQKLVGPINSK